MGEWGSFLSTKMPSLLEEGDFRSTPKIGEVPVPPVKVNLERHSSFSSHLLTI